MVQVAILSDEHKQKADRQSVICFLFSPPRYAPPTPPDRDLRGHPPSVP